MKRAARSIDWSSVSPPCHYNLGLALEARGRVEEAQEAYRESLEIAPGWAAPLERLRARSSR
jgi:hypothetical protein